MGKNFDEFNERVAKRELSRLAAFVLRHHLPEIRSGESAVDFAIRSIKMTKRMKRVVEQ